MSLNNWRLVIITALSGGINGMYEAIRIHHPNVKTVAGNKAKSYDQAENRAAQLHGIAIETLGEVSLSLSLADVPQMPRSVAWFPAIFFHSKKILEILQVGNPQSSTRKWKVAKVSEPKLMFLKVENFEHWISPVSSENLGNMETFLPQALWTSSKPEASNSCNHESILSSEYADLQSVSRLVRNFFEGSRWERPCWIWSRGSEWRLHNLTFTTLKCCQLIFSSECL